MLSDIRTFSSNELFDYLKLLAKKFRKLNGKNTPAELYLVGGASILLNYNFREMTSDIDAIIRASSAMKDAIRQVSDEHNLPIDWLNTDFKNTTSYTPNIMKYADYRCELSNVLRVYTISAEYLVAMKLKAGRSYKHDLSDVVGILAEHNDLSRNNGRKPITMDMINTAIINLYGSLDAISDKSYAFVNQVIETNNYSILLEETKADEKKAAEHMSELKQKYPNVMNCDNVEDILKSISEKEKNKTVSSFDDTEKYYLEIDSEQLKILEKSGIAFELNPQKTIAAVAKVDKEKALESISKSNKPKLKR